METTSNKYNIHTLIQDFSEIMQGYEAEDSVKTQGDKPVFPILFVTVGGQSEDIFSELQKRLTPCGRATGTISAIFLRSRAKSFPCSA